MIEVDLHHWTTWLGIAVHHGTCLLVFFGKIFIKYCVNVFIYCSLFLCEWVGVHGGAWFLGALYCLWAMLVGKRSFSSSIWRWGSLQCWEQVAWYGSGGEDMLVPLLSWFARLQVWYGFLGGTLSFSFPIFFCPLKLYSKSEQSGMNFIGTSRHLFLHGVPIDNHIRPSSRIRV